MNKNHDNERGNAGTAPYHNGEADSQPQINFLAFLAYEAGRKMLDGHEGTGENHKSALRLLVHFLLEGGGGEACVRTPLPPPARHTADRTRLGHLLAIPCEEIARRLPKGGEACPDSHTQPLAVRGKHGGCTGLSLPAEAVTAALLESFVHHAARKGLCPNTVAAHLRCLRAAYNTAVRLGLAADARPFLATYTGTTPTRKRALDENTVEAVAAAPLQGQGGVELARDLYLFSLTANGMPFADMAALTTANLRPDGTLVYVRKKTKRPVAVPLTKCLRAILRKYEEGRERRGGLLLPVLSQPETARGEYKRALARQNTRLAELAGRLGLHVHLTTYTARHTWATCALRRGVPVAAISEAMGHSCEAVTRIYLDSIGTDRLAEANERAVGGFARSWMRAQAG